MTPAEDWDALGEELEVAAAVAAADPIAALRLTNPQDGFLRVQAREALIRGGNKIGKSKTLAAHVVMTCRGTHPYRRRFRGPVRVLVVGESWEQMDGLIELIWELLPKHEIDPKVNFVSGAGITGYKKPHIRFVAGPGKGSIIHFATYQQGAKRIAGGKYHLVVLDEPPPEAVYGECLGRIGSPYFGDLRVGFTPTLETHEDVGYLKDRCAKGKCVDFQVSFGIDAVTPRGSKLLDVPWMTPSQVEEVIESYLPIERDMRVHGAWDPAFLGRVIAEYDERHFGDHRPPPGVECLIAVGVDHGVKVGRQVAVLAACAVDGSRVWFIDEAVEKERTTSRDDAQAILDMLARNGLTWDKVDYWLGDRAHGGDQYSSGKDNNDLEHEFGILLKVTRKELRRRGLQFHQPFKTGGSKWRGSRLLNNLFGLDQAWVSKRCPNLHRALLAWEGRDDDPEKDKVDAARYIVERLQDDRALKLRSRPSRAHTAPPLAGGPAATA